MAATASFLQVNITRLILFANGNRISNATGFFIENDDDWFLVSNWHVLSGRHPTTGQTLHKGGGVPDSVSYIRYSIENNKLRSQSVTIPLVNSISGESYWLQHKDLGQDIDIAAIKVTEVGMAKKLINPDGHDEKMYIDAGYEVFLPGYPLGIGGPGHLPIWKRASVATSLEVGDQKCFLVDTASREGMSGSPCFSIANWQYYRQDPQTGKLTVVQRPLSHRLLGVYSGRINPSDQLEAQLGIVWREHLLFEILRNGIEGSYIIRQCQQT